MLNHFKYIANKMIVNLYFETLTGIQSALWKGLCRLIKSAFYGILAERVRYFKEDEEGVATMCRAMEEMRNDTAFKTMLNAVRELMKSCGWTAEQALLNLNIPVQEHPRYLAAI